MNRGNLEAIKHASGKGDILEDALERHPHEFSGGQRQRIAIARAGGRAEVDLYLGVPVAGGQRAT